MIILILWIKLIKKHLVGSEYLNKILNLLVKTEILLKQEDLFTINNNFNIDQDELILKFKWH